MLNDKLKFMTTTLSKQIQEQADHAHEVDGECKKLKAELQRQLDQVSLKQFELKKLNDGNDAIKKMGYDRKIEDLQRQLNKQEKERNEFQTKLENLHT